MPWNHSLTKNKTIEIMKQAKFFLFLLMLLAPMCGNAAEQGYAVFDPATGTLTFSYGEKPSGKYVYDTDDTGINEPWPSEKLKKVVFEKSFEKARPKSTQWWFVAASELTEINGLPYLNTSQVTQMLGMFDGCSSLTSLDVSHFNTSNVISLNYLFCDCSGLKSLDVSHFNTSNVIDMIGMFSGCSGLTSLDLSNFDTHYVACNGRDDMFLGCNSLKTIYIGDNWGRECIDYPPNVDVFLAGEVINKEQGYAVFDWTTGTLTFKYGRKPAGDYVYDTDDTGEWSIWSTKNLKKVVFEESFAKARPQSTRFWFSNATDLTKIEGIQYLNTSEVTSMWCMFNECSSLTSIDVSHFDTSNVYNMTLMFSGCSSLTSIDLHEFDTRKLKNCSEMFSGCSALTSVDLRYFNTQNLDDCSKMFSGCSSLTSLDLRSFDTNRARMDDMFAGCDKLKTVNISDDWSLHRTTYPSNLELVIAKKRGYAVYDSDTGTMTFKYGDRLSGKRLYYTDYYFDEDEDWPTWRKSEIGCNIKKAVFEPSFAEARPKTIRGWFALGSEYLTEIEGIEYLNTSEVTDMSLLFMEQRNLTSIDLSHFDTSKVLNMDSMFESCSGLTSLDLSHFDTSNVINMRDMFIACTSLTSLDLSSFDTGNVEYMDYMFAFCDNLQTIYVSDKWSTAKVYKGENMFDNSNILIGGKGTIYDDYHIDYDYAHADGGAEDPGYLTLVNEDGTYPPKQTSQDDEGAIYRILEDNTAELFNGTHVKGDYVIPKTIVINYVEYPVTRIRREAFWYNSDLTSVTIPNSVNNIGDYAFAGCNGLTKVISLIENPDYIYGSEFAVWDKDLHKWIYNSPATLYVPEGTAEKYIDNLWYPRFSSIIEGESTVRMFINDHIRYSVEADGTVAVAEVNGDYGADVLIIPENVTFEGTTYVTTKIRRNAFYFYDDLHSLTIPATITCIEDQLDIYDNNFTSIIVKEGNPVYDSRDNCNAIIETATNTLVLGCKNTTIPPTVTAIGERAFRNCADLTTIKLPDNLVSIGEFAFEETGLISVELPAGLSSIGFKAFVCNKLVSVVSRIENPFNFEDETKFSAYDYYNNGYYNHSSNATLYVPAGTTEDYKKMGWAVQFAKIVEGEPGEVFKESSSVYQAQSENTVAIMASDVVEAEYVIPETVNHDGTDYTVTAINNNAFKNHVALTTVSIPETVVTIGDGAFAGCSNLTAIYAYATEPAHLTTIAPNTRTTSSSVFEGVDKENCVLYVPKGCVEKYRSAEGWGEFVQIVEMEGTGISGLTMNRKMFDVYNLSGRKIRTSATSLDGLPKGIYIVNGKKVVK